MTFPIRTEHPHPDPVTRYPCGCLRNDAGAHRDPADDPCPDYETVYPASGSTRLEGLSWKRREGR